MENPFKLILHRLDSIEDLIKATMKNKVESSIATEIFNLNQAAEYVNLSKSAVYKKNSGRSIPHFKRGKKLYFKRSELDDWLTELRIATNSDIEKQAVDYIWRKRRLK